MKSTCARGLDRNGLKAQVIIFDLVESVGRIKIQNIYYENKKTLLIEKKTYMTILNYLLNVSPMTLG